MKTVRKRKRLPDAPELLMRQRIFARHRHHLFFLSGVVRIILRENLS